MAPLEYGYEYLGEHRPTMVLTPAFERSIAMNDHGGALTALRVSLAVETACVIGILALVAWLGALAPPASGM